MTYKSLEAMRGIAAILVVVHHIPFAVSTPGNLAENASLFVDFFFILSGFVMTHAYAERIGEGLGFARFAALRLGRLFPLHAALMFAWLGMVLAFPALSDLTSNFDERHTAETFLLNLALLNSFGLTGLAWNYPSWSIGAELAAYLVFFLVVAAIGARLTAAVALAIALAAYSTLLLDGGTTIQRTFDLGALRCIGGFFLGVALYRSRARLLRPAVPGTAAEAASVALVVVLLSLDPGSIWVEALTLLAFCGVIQVFAGSRGRLSAVLEGRVPAFLGRISYSVYLGHALVVLLIARAVDRWGDAVPVVVMSEVHPPRIFLQTPIAGLLVLLVIGVTVALAALTFRWIEEPFRIASKRRFSMAAGGAARPASRTGGAAAPQA